ALGRHGGVQLSGGIPLPLADAASALPPGVVRAADGLDDGGGQQRAAAGTGCTLMNSDWRIHRLDQGLGEHAPAWDALNRQLFDSHPMLDSRFINGMLAHFGSGSEYLCVLEAEGAV